MARNVFGVTPRMVVLIGEVPVLVKSAEIILTNKSEPDTATVNVALDNIDSSVFQQPGKYFPIQIWAGYIDEANDKSELVKDLIEGGQYKTKLYKRYDGFVDQPEWSHGDEEMVTLHCKDAAGLLSDGKFSDKLEGSQTSAKNIIGKINNAVMGIKVIFDAKDFSMGKKDSKGEKQTYSIAGKSYWDVIKDIAEQGALNIQKDATTIKLSKMEQWKEYWEMVRTATKNPDSDWSTFTTLKIRYGEKGKRGKEQVVVRVLGSTQSGGQRGKKTSSRAIDVVWPTGSKQYNGEENTEYIEIKIGLCTPERAKQIAEYQGKEYLRGLMTGTVEVPFANPLMKADEGIGFKCDVNYGLKHLDGKKFRIHTINEKFDEDGYGQSVEFESNAHIEEAQRIAPAPVTDNGSKPSGYSLTIPLGMQDNGGGFMGSALPRMGPGLL